MEKINLEEIQDFYNYIPSVWSDDDIWHMYSREQIMACIQKCDFLNNTDIINAGSGGNEYNIKYNRMLHVDIAEDKVKQCDDFLISNIENLPLFVRIPVVKSSCKPRRFMLFSRLFMEY